ncbi:MAG: ABC transporter ATP-binding protein [Betaproteobacteria bacterium]|nr:ABC transporter ATP-binding protein [Betaproteobacteria bacterium]
MSDILLETTGLTKHFGALLVSDHIDLRLKRGARQALIGPNGAGKSTLVGLLSGTLVPDAGRVFLAGEDVTTLAPHRRVKRGLARTFQINSQFQQLTVLENVYLALSEAHGASRQLFRPAWANKELIARAEALIDELGLGEERHWPVAKISYGKQRIVEIALALALNPKVLLLDEPAAGVPGNEMARVLDVIARLPADMAILIIEHDMKIVRRFAREVMVLVNGAVFMSGPPEDVMASPEVRAVYLGRAAGARTAVERSSHGHS